MSTDKRVLHVSALGMFTVPKAELEDYTKKEEITYYGWTPTGTEDRGFPEGMHFCYVGGGNRRSQLAVHDEQAAADARGEHLYLLEVAMEFPWRIDEDLPSWDTKEDPSICGLIDLRARRTTKETMDQIRTLIGERQVQKHIARNPQTVALIRKRLFPQAEGVIFEVDNHAGRRVPIIWLLKRERAVAIDPIGINFSKTRFVLPERSWSGWNPQ